MTNQVPCSPADPAASHSEGVRRTGARATAAAVCGALAALTAALLPAGADAAVVTRPAGSSQFTLLAAPGEVNRVRVSDDGPGFVRIRDESPLAKDTNRCESVSRTEVRCQAEPATSVVLLLLDGADRAEVTSTLRVGVDGGAGNDTYAGGLAPGRSNVLFRGGADVDTASYFDATAGVTVRIGDGPGDGRPGDGDEIADAERVIGSRFGDGLDASRAQPAVGAELDGGSGIDILTGSELRDVLVSGPGGDFLSGRGGADRLVAGDGDRDTVDCGSGNPDDALVSIAGERTISGCERVIPVRPPASVTQPGTPVGTLRLTPETLRAEVGTVARLGLRWRHPRGWRQLRRIELRAYSGDARVGAVSVQPRSRRLRDAGKLTIVRRATRVVRKGKSVHARLALRIDPSLAGRRLRVEIEAVDIRGARQRERDAGAIRVAG